MQSSCRLMCSTASVWTYFTRKVCCISKEGDLVLDNLISTLLKTDQWRRESHHVEHGVRGAINFRNIPNSNIYALGQPSVEAIDEVVERVKQAHLGADRVVWITLREEPIVYINGAPYCLRRETFSLRNMKGLSFSFHPMSCH